MTKGKLTKAQAKALCVAALGSAAGFETVERGREYTWQAGNTRARITAAPCDKAVVEIPSLGNRKFTGIVNEISWISTDMNVANPSYYTVELTVPNPDLVLKPGFKAVVHFGGGGQAAAQ